MKNLTIGIITGTAVFLLAAMSALAVDQSFQINVSITPPNTGPDVYLAYRAIDIGIDVDGSGSSINPSNIRNSNYAFMGEKIYYYVLVRDNNGAEDINLVKWTRDGGPEMGPCDDITSTVVGIGPGAYFCVPGKTTSPCASGTKPIYINQATNLLYDAQTDKIYRCILTVESSWTNTLISVVATDFTSGKPGSTLAENWTFNPKLSVSTNGNSLIFNTTQYNQAVPGVTSPNCLIKIPGESLISRDCKKYKDLPPGEKLCDISFSANKITVTNNGDVVDLWPFIAATNFYTSNGMAKCPFSNELSANQFEYRATQGSWDSGWRVMPQYSPNMNCSGPTLFDSCRGGCRITEGCPINVLSPGRSLELQFKIVWPTPCIGNFTNGSIYIIVRAV